MKNKFKRKLKKHDIIINGFKVVSNGLTKAEMRSGYDYIIPDNEYIISSKRKKIIFIGWIDEKDGTITVTEDDYTSLSVLTDIENIKFTFRKFELF